MYCCRPIGVFDSGIGGLNVLRELQKLMPRENYVYFADTEHAPYGEKSAEEILRYCRYNVKRLVDAGCKAIVIACNTATAVAVEELRRTFSVPIFGIEPAVKPAVEKGGNVLVLTTERTAKEERFRQLVYKFASDSKAKIYTVPVQKLVTLVEQKNAESEEAINYLENVFKKFEKIKFSSCVLGCTHFSSAKKAIEKALGYKCEFYDGSYGTARYVKLVLEKEKLCNLSEKDGEVLFLNQK